MSNNVIRVDFGSKKEPAGLDKLVEISRGHVLKTLREAGFHPGTATKTADLIASIVQRELEPLHASLSLQLKVTVNATSLDPEALMRAVSDQVSAQWLAFTTQLFTTAQMSIIAAATSTCTAMAHSDQL